MVLLKAMVTEREHQHDGGKSAASDDGTGENYDDDGDVDDVDDEDDYDDDTDVQDDGDHDDSDGSQ